MSLITALKSKPARGRAGWCATAIGLASAVLAAPTTSSAEGALPVPPRLEALAAPAGVSGQVFLDQADQASKARMNLA